MIAWRAIVATVALGLAAPALAQEAPRFCPNRPSLGESGCTTEPGHAQIEFSAVDWQLDRTPDRREDTLLGGDLQLRLGVTPTSELQVAWTPYGHVRTRDRLTGAVDTSSSTGDVQIGWRQNLRHPDGKGLSLAIEPSVTLPAGGDAIGAGTWAAGVVVPVTYDLTKTLKIGLTNDVEAAANLSGEGRHFAVVETLTLTHQLSKQVSAAAELQVTQDNDPAGHATLALAAGSLAWQPHHGLQLYALAAAGLNRETPDVRLFTGAAFGF